MAILYNQNDLTITDEYVQCKGKIKIPFSDIGCVKYFPERSLLFIIRLVGLLLVVGYLLTDTDIVDRLAAAGGFDGELVSLLLMLVLFIGVWVYCRKKDAPYLVIESKHSRGKDDLHWVMGDSKYRGYEIARIDHLDEEKLECIFDVLKSAVSKYSNERELSVSAGTGKILFYKMFYLIVEEKKDKEKVSRTSLKMFDAKQTYR